MNQLSTFGRNASMDVMSFSTHHIRKDVVSVSPVTDAHFDGLVGVSAGFLRCTITILPFVMNKYLVRRYSKTMQLSCFSSNFNPLLIAASINESFLKQ